MKTTEEKARAYDEAIERAKESYKVCGHDFDAELEYIFPELCESEDEGIRKELIKFVKNTTNPYSDQQKKYLEWLEKQKPAEWSEEDEKRLSHVISFLEDKDRWKDTERAFPIEEDIMWLKSLRPQKQYGYNPYKAVVESIAEMCRHYDKASHSALRDFYDNVKVKCKDAKEYDTKYPQKQWKPSEEQMMYLAAAIEEGNENPVLASLYNDLKQL